MTKYQFLPDLLTEEYEALKASIAERGVDVLIIVDQDGNIIDGYHRNRACEELGIFCPREVRDFTSEADKFELALRLNCRRRQLSRKQKRELIAAYLVRDPQIADNHLVEIIGGISKNTVADVRGELEATCQIDKFKKLRGKDGKDRPTKYNRIIANTPKEEKAALKLIGELPDDCDGVTLDIRSAQKLRKRPGSPVPRHERLNWSRRSISKRRNYRNGVRGDLGSGTTHYGWFVWEHGYQGAPKVSWLPLNATDAA